MLGAPPTSPSIARHVSIDALNRRKCGDFALWRRTPVSGTAHQVAPLCRASLVADRVSSELKPLPLLANWRFFGGSARAGSLTLGRLSSDPLH